ncbi:phosphomethylpyrimidine synthase ThiC [Methanosalsum natronophilum]|uniref:Phosphomethylpyrimidine synthase n=1 Tax=Methanosalsum natronophilum TaxID=768733 RepID=A0A424Z4R9_9EURY|nr:MAG: phosphomethylpyrimidine synthase ThiC [Methanosalsum natronophilum]
MTLMKDAKNGIITDEMKKVALFEDIDEETICSCVAKGLITIPKNIKRDSKPFAIGKYMSTKINANIGTSRDFTDVDNEVLKAKAAESAGVHTLMDLSTGGNLDAIRKRIIKNITIPIGTVPIYQAAESRSSVVDMTADDMFNALRKQADDGVEFVTIHAGINKNSIERLQKSDRILDIVSRGGSFTLAWMLHNEKENPFYAEYDYLLDIAAEYDLTISLGDGMRPGCVADATDRPKFIEFIILGELVKLSRENNIQTFVEGPGHVPINEIEISVKSMKHLCNEAPLYLLGPLVTDLAPGYDHITAAIGGSVAGMHGADFLCMTTPSEHLALPTIDDIKEGANVTKIAAHAANLVKEGQKEKELELNKEMAYARKSLDWDKQYKLSINPEHARNIRESRISCSDACSMCGDLCAMKIIDKALNKV